MYCFLFQQTLIEKSLCSLQKMLIVTIRKSNILVGIYSSVFDLNKFNHDV